MANEPKRFTDSSVAALKATDKLKAYGDPGCKGLSIRVTPDGTKTWYFGFRSKITGKPENKRVGEYPAVSLADAHKLVNKAWELVEASKPVEFSVAKKNEPTVADRLNTYKELKLDKKRTGGARYTMLNTFFTRFKLADLPPSSLRKMQLMEALEEMAKTAPRSAHNTQSALTTFLKWCAERDYIIGNPIAGMSSVDEDGESIRTRSLTEAEVRKLWTVCVNREHGLLPSYADAILLLLATGYRSGMVCGATREEFFGFGDQPAPYQRGAGAVQDFAGERMKMGLPFVNPLNSHAQEIVQRRFDMTNGEFLFPTAAWTVKDKGKALRVRRLSEICRQLSKKLGWTKEGQGPGSPFVPHDARRTLTDLLCRDRKNKLADVSKLLAHEERKGVMKHYKAQQRWDDFDTKRELSDAWAVMLAEITRPRSTGAVVEIRRAA